MIKYFCVVLLSLYCMANAFAQAPAPPPPGQGINPAPVIPGDLSSSPPVPTGLANSLPTTKFPQQSEQIPETIYLRADTYSHNIHQYMGKHIVLSIRPSTLDNMRADLIHTILPLDSSQIINHVAVIDVSQGQLQEIEKILDTGSEETNTSVQTWLFHYLPIVKKFSAKAISLGLVFATVMLSIAAFGVVMSHRGSTDKAISTTAGLIVLLMAYSIYCLLISNASGFHISSPRLP